MQNNTIRLHRVLRATPEKIYKAFLDPDAMAKWLPPNGFTARVHQTAVANRRQQGRKRKIVAKYAHCEIAFL